MLGLCSAAIAAGTLGGTYISLQDKSGKDACPAPGTYKYTLAGKTLKLTKVSDANPACSGRVVVLGGTTQVR